MACAIYWELPSNLLTSWLDSGLAPVFFDPIGAQNEILYLFYSIGFNWFPPLCGVVTGMPTPPVTATGLRTLMPLELNLLNTKSVPLDPMPFADG